MKKRFTLLAAASLLGAVAIHAETFPYQDQTLSPYERAADLVSRMTLEEKINQVGHKTDAISRLGLQGYNYWSEAIHGVAHFIPGVKGHVIHLGPSSDFRCGYRHLRRVPYLQQQ